MTFATSSSRPSSSVGMPLLTPLTRGTRRMPAARRSPVFMRISGAVFMFGSILRPIGVSGGSRGGAMALPRAAAARRCDRWTLWGAVSSGRDDHVRRLVRAGARGDAEPVAGAFEALDTNSVANWQREPRRIGGQVIGYFVLGRKRQRRRGKPHTRKAVVLRRCEYAQRVPSRAPGIANAFIGVEDDERAALLAQKVPCGQSRLTTADDDSVESRVHRVPPCSCHLD